MKMKKKNYDCGCRESIWKCRELTRLLSRGNWKKEKGGMGGGGGE